jgi:predicted transcriptional regulator
MYCTQHIEKARYFYKKTDKLLGKSENLFLSRLIFWSESSKGYGILKEGRGWIYNTLDEWAKQLKISKSSVRRAISSLKAKGIVDAEYLSANRRDRTLFYSVNHEKLKQFFNKEEKSCSCVQKTGFRKHINEHMEEHMYIETENSKQIINKSNKSRPAAVDILKEKDLKKEKPTIVQDMIKIWKEEISPEVILTPKLSQYLVKIFKERFNSSLKEWKRYLKLIKTSAYLMKEEFKLTLFWAIKFITIDRLRAGELGVKEDKIPLDISELEEKAEKHIAFLDETEKCKEIRRKIVKDHGPAIYNAWFEKVRLIEERGGVVLHYPNSFTRDYIQNYHARILEMEGLKDESEYIGSLDPEEKVEWHIRFSDEAEISKEIRRKIIRKLGAKIYNTWFEPLQFVEEKGRVNVKYPSQFFEIWVQDHYSDFLEREGLNVNAGENRRDFKKLKKHREIRKEKNLETGVSSNRIEKVQFLGDGEQLSTKNLNILIENTIQKYPLVSSRQGIKRFASPISLVFP